MTKYIPTINKLEQRGSYHTMQKEGFSKSQIINALYKETRGASLQERKKIFKNMTEKGD